MRVTFFALASYSSQLNKVFTQVAKGKRQKRGAQVRILLPT